MSKAELFSALNDTLPDFLQTQIFISTATLTLFLDALMVIGCGVILFIQNRILYDGFSAEEFVRWYYRKRFKGIDFESEIKMYAEDYVEMCLETEEKFKLSCDLTKPD